MVNRLAALLLALAVLTGCADEDPDETRGTASPDPTTSVPSSTPPGSSEEPTASQPEATGTKIVVRGSDFGPMLFDVSGQAIYLFDVETTSKPACYGECAEAWPPVLSEGEPSAGTGVDAALLGTVERRDGSTQVTYNDHPLYFYAHEAENEVKCHDVFLNGGNWYVVQPGGDAAPPG